MFVVFFLEVFNFSLIPNQAQGGADIWGEQYPGVGADKVFLLRLQLSSSTTGAFHQIMRSA